MTWLLFTHRCWKQINWFGSTTRLRMVYILHIQMIQSMILLSKQDRSYIELWESSLPEINVVAHLSWQGKIKQWQFITRLLIHYCCIQRPHFMKNLKHVWHSVSAKVNFSHTFNKKECTKLFDSRQNMNQLYQPTSTFKIMEWTWNQLNTWYLKFNSY